MGKFFVSQIKAAQASLATYFRDIQKAPLLDAAEEKSLASRVEEGDREARDHLVRANLRLVVYIARRYLGRGLDLEDLIAEGNLGLMRAVQSFDPSMGTRFSTFASFWIKATIQHAIRYTSRPIRIPTALYGLLVKWRRTRARLRDQLGRAPTEDEVARQLNFPPKKLRYVLHALHISKAMPKTGYAFEEWSPEKDLPDHRSALPERWLVRAEELRRVFVLLTKLDERQVQVLCLRFGLGGESPCTLSEISQRFGLTRERVRQIEEGALGELAELLQPV
jgi:RNA polymerase primary sigma factor